ncbi:MAG: type II secretion system protein [Bermanella sp.]
MRHINKLIPHYPQSGFTLIELIMVIVILGILSAFALPKFADFSDQAEESTAEGARGSVKSATAITHAQALATGSTGATSTITIEGSIIDMVHGYPSANDAGVNGNICTAAGIDLTDFSCTTSAGDGTANSPRVATITLLGSTCAFTYTEVDADEDPIVPSISSLNCP